MSWFVRPDGNQMPEFFNDEVHKDKIPSDAVPIDEAIWSSYLDDPGRFKFKDGKLTKIGVAEQKKQDLDRQQEERNASIKMEISKLEASQTLELMRKTILGDSAANESLRSIDYQITNLQSKLGGK